jgi:hypothetical protein
MRLVKAVACDNASANSPVLRLALPSRGSCNSCTSERKAKDNLKVKWAAESQQVIPSAD